MQTTEPTHGKGLLLFAEATQFTVFGIVLFIYDSLNLVEMWPPSECFARFQWTVRLFTMVVVVPSSSTRWEWGNTNGCVLWVNKRSPSIFVSCSFKVNSCKNCTWNMRNDGHIDNDF